MYQVHEYCRHYTKDRVLLKSLVHILPIRPFERSPRPAGRAGSVSPTGSRLRPAVNLCAGSCRQSSASSIYIHGKSSTLHALWKPPDRHIVITILSPNTSRRKRCLIQSGMRPVLSLMHLKVLTILLKVNRCEYAFTWPSFVAYGQ